MYSSSHETEADDFQEERLFVTQEKYNALFLSILHAEVCGTEKYDIRDSERNEFHVPVRVSLTPEYYMATRFVPHTSRISEYKLKESGLVQWCRSRKRYSCA